MNKYKVYFKFNEKKMAMIVEAESKMEAEYYVQDKLVIDSVVLLEGTEPTRDNKKDDEGLDAIKSMFGMK